MAKPQDESSFTAIAIQAIRVDERTRIAEMIEETSRKLHNSSFGATGNEIREALIRGGVQALQEAATQIRRGEYR